MGSVGYAIQNVSCRQGKEITGQQKNNIKRVIFVPVKLRPSQVFT
jgi:hypothetical protein